MSLDNLKKHAGVLKNTGVRVAVVFRKLPTDDQFCLIVETERLPDAYHDAVIQIMNSKEAAETNDLYEVLNRRTFPDGTNCLTSLHQRSYLRREPVSNVNMLPLPGHSVPLELINATIDKKIDEYIASQSKLTPELADVVEELDTLSIAKGLVVQAQLLEADAESKREEAYTMHPELRPGKGRPTLPEDVKAIKLAEQKAKRRERDQRNAAVAKVEKKSSAIEDKVNAKIIRDAERQSLPTS